MTTTKTSTYSSIFESRQQSPCGFVYDAATVTRRAFPAYDPSGNCGVGGDAGTPPTIAQPHHSSQQQDSDCGSSSGLGGMTKHESSSETSSLESDARDSGGGGRGSIPAASNISGGTLPRTQPSALAPAPAMFAAPPPRFSQYSLHVPPTIPIVHPKAPLYTTTAPAFHPVMVSNAAASVMSTGPSSNGPVPSANAPSAGSAGASMNASTSGANVPVPPAGLGTASLPPGIPPISSATGAVSDNDLFLHVHAGDTMLLAVGNEVQHITGPATIRMIGQSGLPPSALPLHVPRGHVIQQLVDRQGILRHLILSPEAKAAPPSSRVSTARECVRAQTAHRVGICVFAQG